MTCRGSMFLILIWLSVGLMGQSRSIEASLALDTDTIALGRPITVTLSIRHPADVMIEFPTSRDFSPFELVKSVSEPTRTEGKESWDVVHYEIRTFSLAPKQVLNLPYAWYGARDTGRASLLADSLELRGRIPELSDSLSYRSSTDLLPISDPPNYLRLMLVSLFGLLILFGIAFFLRRPIRRYWKLRNLNRNWDRTQKGLERLSKEPNQEIQLESINRLWRTYLDPYQKHQLGAMTTTELREGIQALTYLRMEDQQALIKAADFRDRVSFAGQPLKKPELHSLIQSLEKIIDRTYEYRKARIQKSR